jgi:surface antigen
MPLQRLHTAITAGFKKPVFVALSTTILVIILPLFFSLTPSVSIAQSTCQCTDYVASRFGLTRYPDARDWDNGYLREKGFRQINSPENGAIVVLNPNVAGAFELGHVGVVEQYTTTGNSLKLNIRGTNQPGVRVSNEYGCNNVTIWSNNTNVINNPGVTYWVRGNSTSINRVINGVTVEAFPFYRYWKASVGDHFYTTNYSELGGGTDGYIFERIEAYIPTSQYRGTIPFYRYWNPTTGDHFYTPDYSELGGGRYGYLSEGIAGYIFDQGYAGTCKLFRYWNPTIDDHFYTTDYNELGEGRHGYVKEPPEYFVLKNGSPCYN